MRLGLLVIDHLNSYTRPTVWYQAGEVIDGLHGIMLMKEINDALANVAHADDYDMGFLRWDDMQSEGFTTKVDLGDIDALAVAEVKHAYDHMTFIWTMESVTRMDGRIAVKVTTGRLCHVRGQAPQRLSAFQPGVRHHRRPGVGRGFGEPPV